jgi:hypothetical protein
MIGINLSSLSLILQGGISTGHTDDAIEVPWIFLKVIVDDNLELIASFDGISRSAARHGSKVPGGRGAVATSHASRV